MEVVRTVVSERQRKLGSRVIEYRFQSNDLEENLVLQSEFGVCYFRPLYIVHVCTFKRHILCTQFSHSRAVLRCVFGLRAQGENDAARALWGTV